MPNIRQFIPLDILLNLHIKYINAPIILLPIAHFLVETLQPYLSVLIDTDRKRSFVIRKCFRKHFSRDKGSLLHWLACDRILHLYSSYLIYKLSSL